jgi:MFS family permease
MPDRGEEKKPLDLKLSALAIVSIAAGGGAAAAAGFGENSGVAGLISLFVVIAAIAVPQPATFKAGIASGVVAGLALLLAHVTGASPVLAGVSMAAVALLTGVAVAGGPIAGAIGTIIGTAYFIPAALSLTDELSSGKTAELGLIGLAAGIAVVALVVLVQKARGNRPRGGKAGPDRPKADPDQPRPLALIATAIRHPSPERNYGIRRALLLGFGVGLYLATDNHNVFWVLLTIFSVLQLDMEKTWSKAIARSSGTVAGAIAVGALAQVLPAQVVVGIGVAALVVTIAFYRRDYLVFTAGVSFLVVALLGQDQGDFLNWAALRAGDAILGAAIAIAAVYFILPEKEGIARPT